MADRTYSTREIAQMWNVSESTVKRWADSFGLHCYRTPGGHRRFRLEDIYEFQQKRAFEATGLLSTEDWEDPDLEIYLNARNFERVRELLLYLASHNQRAKARFILERLYLRGMRLEEIYDQVLAPLFRPHGSVSELGVSRGEELIAATNIDEALVQLSQKMVRSRSNGKTALCASPSNGTRIPVGTTSRLLEIEGWDCFNLGDGVPLRVMSEIVEAEPINLVCLYLGSSQRGDPQEGQSLQEICRSYRIPLVVLLPQGPQQTAPLEADECFDNLCSFRRFVDRLS